MENKRIWLWWIFIYFTYCTPIVYAARVGSFFLELDSNWLLTWTVLRYYNGEKNRCDHGLGRTGCHLDELSTLFKGEAEQPATAGRRCQDVSGVAPPGQAPDRVELPNHQLQLNEATSQCASCAVTSPQYNIHATAHHKPLKTRLLNLCILSCDTFAEILLVKKKKKNCIQQYYFDEVPWKETYELSPLTRPQTV